MGIDASGNTAPLDQIRNRGYLEKYAADSRKKYAIGIVFHPKERNIERFEFEVVL
jgi:hypothetical protein